MEAVPNFLSVRKRSLFRRPPFSFSANGKSVFSAPYSAFFTCSSTVKMSSLNSALLFFYVIFFAHSCYKLVKCRNHRYEMVYADAALP